MGEKRYDFDRDRMRFEFNLALRMRPDAICLIGDRYHKIREFSDRSFLLEFFEMFKSLPDFDYRSRYFDTRPLWKNFYEDLEAREKLRSEE